MQLCSEITCGRVINGELGMSSFVVANSEISQLIWIT